MAYVLVKEKLDDVLKDLTQGRGLFAIEQVGKRCHLVPAKEWAPGKFTLGSHRPVESIKALVFPPREYLGPAAAGSRQSSMSERIVVGVKNCDLAALRVHDHVFRDTEPPDPFYSEAREKTLIVSSDCTEPCEVCFCTAVGQRPYAESGYDINVSPVSSGYVMEAASPRGEALLAALKQHLEPANGEIMSERDRRRQETTRTVESRAAAKGLRPGLNLQGGVQKATGSSLWEELAENCVECGACNLVCSTCHCFVLADGTTRNRVAARTRQWDSCLYRNFARVAGGANPRKRRAERLHNRFDKKFNFFVGVLGTYACNGCGRCTEACAGKIDIRDVLKRLAEAV